MKLGVLTVPLASQPVEEAFRYLSGLGVTAVELGVGGYPGSDHLNPAEMLGDQKQVEEFKVLLDKYDLEISALSVHANNVHPDEEIAQKGHDEFINACRMAEKLSVDTVITFSGCPGGEPGSKVPNWVTCAWPAEYPAILDYQWNDVLIPYWKNTAKLAAGYGVNKIAFEMHPGFCVYNPGTLLRLRAAVGNSIGANFDPSHLVWQGIDPVIAIKALKEAIFHFHAKDTRLDRTNISLNGVLDATHYGDVLNRAWTFRTVGYGHDYKVWNDMISCLKAVGYDGAISIEHEDAQMSIKEGLEKAIAFLKQVIIFEKPAAMWWA